MNFNLPPKTIAITTSLMAGAIALAGCNEKAAAGPNELSDETCEYIQELQEDIAENPEDTTEIYRDIDGLERSIEGKGEAAQNATDLATVAGYWAMNSEGHVAGKDYTAQEVIDLSDQVENNYCQ